MHILNSIESVISLPNIFQKVRFMWFCRIVIVNKSTIGMVGEVGVAKVVRLLGTGN